MPLAHKVKGFFVMGVDSPFIEHGVLAEHLRIRVNTLRYLARKRWIPQIRIKGRALFPRDKILYWLKTPQSGQVLGWARCAEAEGLIKVILERERLKAILRRKVSRRRLYVYPCEGLR